MMFSLQTFTMCCRHPGGAICPIFWMFKYTGHLHAKPEDPWALESNPIHMTKNPNMSQSTSSSRSRLKQSFPGELHFNLLKPKCGQTCA